MFRVPKNIVCAESDFFKAACTGKWREASEKLVRLPEADPHIFGVYVGWLYTGRLDLSECVNDNPLPKYKEAMPNDDFAKATLRIVDSYVLGDMLRDSRFANALVDEFARLVEGSNLLPSHENIISAIWLKLPQGSTIGRLLVDYFAVDYDPDLFADDIDRYPADMIKEIAKAGVRDSRTPWKERLPENRGKCFYHEHNDESKKCP